MYLLANWFGENCANGMSWLLKKKALEEEGGLGAFAEYLAEDFFMGKALWLRLMCVCVCVCVCITLTSPLHPPSLAHTHTHTLQRLETCP